MTIFPERRVSSTYVRRRIESFLEFRIIDNRVSGNLGIIRWSCANFTSEFYFFEKPTLSKFLLNFSEIRSLNFNIGGWRGYKAEFNFHFPPLSKHVEIYVLYALYNFFHFWRTRQSSSSSSSSWMITEIINY